MRLPNLVKGIDNLDAEVLNLVKGIDNLDVEVLNLVKGIDNLVNEVLLTQLSGFAGFTKAIQIL